MPTHPLWRPFTVMDEAAIAAVRVGARVPSSVVVVPYDETWPDRYAELRDLLVAVLGERALGVEHVGSTAVPGLGAKPCLDVDLTVADPADEPAWLPDLEEAGFVLRGREPDFEQHRNLHLGVGPQARVHVFPPGAREPRRHVLFRDWLRSHPDDRAAYEALKREVAAQGFTDAMHYNNAKAAWVYDLYERIFAADPDHPHDSQPRARLDA